MKRKTQKKTCKAQKMRKQIYTLEIRKYVMSHCLQKLFNGPETPTKWNSLSVDTDQKLNCVRVGDAFAICCIWRSVPITVSKFKNLSPKHMGVPALAP